MKKKITAAELMGRLGADPDYVLRRKQKDDELKSKQERYAREELPLLEELNKAGIQIKSIWDLMRYPSSYYAHAIPILINHLQKPYSDAIRDGIARSLAIPSAKPAWPLLVQLYKAESESRTKQGLAVALSNIADTDLIKDLIDMACDPQLGQSRVLLLGALERSHDPRLHTILLELQANPRLHKEVQAILRRLKRKK